MLGAADMISSRLPSRSLHFLSSSTFIHPRGQKILRKDIEYQRPCPSKALTPNESKKKFGKKIKRNINIGDYLKKSDFY